MDSAVTGRIFDIQSYSVHDGPGIRTLIFFKGCSLQCIWCSNPEGIDGNPQIRYFEQECKKFCGDCIDSCPENAIRIDNDSLILDRSRCKQCQSRLCIAACRKKALTVSGYMISVEQLYQKIKKDAPFYGDDGGITLSGGEPFCQPEFLKALVQRCHSSGISTGVESALNVPWEHIAPSLPFLDFLIFDIKLVDSDLHMKYCGDDNARIRENIGKLVRSSDLPLLPRMPVIPGITDRKDNIDAVSRCLYDNGISYIQLMPYTRLGYPKYRQLGMDASSFEITEPQEKNLIKIEKMFKAHQIVCK